MLPIVLRWDWFFFPVSIVTKTICVTRRSVSHEASLRRHDQAFSLYFIVSTVLAHVILTVVSIYWTIACCVPMASRMMWPHDLVKLFDVHIPRDRARPSWWKHWSLVMLKIVRLSQCRMKRSRIQLLFIQCVRPWAKSRWQTFPHCMVRFVVLMDLFCLQSFWVHWHFHVNDSRIRRLTEYAWMRAVFIFLLFFVFRDWCKAVKSSRLITNDLLASLTAELEAMSACMSRACTLIVVGCYNKIR